MPLLLLLVSALFQPQARSASTETNPTVSVSAAAKSHWAFQPITSPAVPHVRNLSWPNTAIDRFILERLEREGLTPSPAASKRVLLRRATFDLTGLPPTPAEMEDFLADTSADAFTKVVERLLHSPRCGERWGRHWLDVARYADSNGMDENLAYANAWRYRDYVVAAFNQDKPYDQFLREQLAGDLLSNPATAGSPSDARVATGFLCIGPKMLAEDDPMKMEMDIVDEQLDSTSRVFMGLTVGCARCHDHKYDPVLMTDYYAMAGIFKSTRTMENFKVVARWQEQPLGTPAQLARWTGQKRAITEATNQVAALIKQANNELLHEARDRLGDYLLEAVEHRQREQLLSKLPAPGGETSKGGEAAPRNTSDTILVEAEHFQRAENVMATTTGYGEGIGVILGQGGKRNATEYDLMLPEAGYYRCELRYAAAESRPVRVQLNGQSANPVVAQKPTGSWNPDTQTWERAGVFAFVAGTNVLRLERDDCFPHIDKLLLVRLSPEDAKGFASTIGETARRSLVPEFVRQWAARLEPGAGGLDTNSILAPWQAIFQHGTLATPTAAWLRVEPPPTTLLETAAAYTELARLVSRVVEERERTAADSKESKPPKLNDPMEEQLRVLLFEGPFELPKQPENYYPTGRIAELLQARKALQAAEQALEPLPEAMAVSDGAAQDLAVHKRGSHLALGDVTPRGFLMAIGAPAGAPFDTNTSGRLQLANWMARREHPLTARVLVNRLWHWHFGEGLVRSPDNFGLLGERPTHPELLDWLAQRFMDSGWSIKAMHRLILASAVYQQASPTAGDLNLPTSAALHAQGARDPENKWWSHFSRRRLEAEEIRDSLLLVSGQLDGRLGGAALTGKNREYVTGTGSKIDLSLFEKPRRSLYLPVVRSALYDVFQVFDFADPSTLNGHRDQTTVAPQALFMLNSRLMAESCRRLAQQLGLGNSADDSTRVAQLYLLAYGRSPTETEKTSATRYLDRYEQAATGEGAKPPRQRAWQSFCRAVLAAHEFIYVD